MLRVQTWLHNKCIKKLENCMNDFIAVDQRSCQARPSFTANNLLVASAAHVAVNCDSCEVFRHPRKSMGTSVLD
jgi:hypothetical protein